MLNQIGVVTFEDGGGAMDLGDEILRLVANKLAAQPKQPAYLIYREKKRVGAVWKKHSEKAGDFHSGVLDSVGIMIFRDKYLEEEVYNVFVPTLDGPKQGQPVVSASAPPAGTVPVGAPPEPYGSISTPQTGKDNDDVPF